MGIDVGNSAEPGSVLHATLVAEVEGLSWGSKAALVRALSVNWADVSPIQRVVFAAAERKVRGG